MTTVAIIGGSFNPPTLQHMIVGLEILRVRPDVDEVWYLPSNHHPYAGQQKSKGEHPPFLYRVHLVEQMICDMIQPSGDMRGDPYCVKVCQIEGEFNTACYTKDVLVKLKERHPKHKFYWVVGGDCLVDLHNWKHYKWLQENVGFLVYPRPGTDERKFEQGLTNANHKDIHVLEGVITSNISSTYVRNNPKATWAQPPHMVGAYPPDPFELAEWEEHQELMDRNLKS